MSKKESYIHVPFEILCNDNINNNAFYLYVILKTSCSNNKVKISTRKLLQNLYWNDKRTLKKYLNELKILGFIMFDFNDFPKDGILNIDIFKVTKPFVRIKRSTILKIIEVTQNTLIKQKKEKTYKDLKEHSLRLYLFYLKNFNKNCGYAFVSYEEIFNITKMSDKYIKSINNTLRKNQILEIKIGDRYVNKNGNNVRERNHYYPLL